MILASIKFIDLIFFSICNTEIASTYRAQGKIFPFPGFLNEFEFVTRQMVEFYTIFLILWRSWHWIASHLICSVLIFFPVPILLGSNRKIGLKWKQNSMSSRGYGYWGFWRFRYKISVNYMSLFDFNMAEAHTCIAEERLQILIKNIFAEEFQKQKKKLLIL